MKVLVIDDEPQIRRALKMGLERNEYIVSLAGSGEEGLDKMATEPFELVVLDLAMPGMDGFEVCRQIRSWSQVPIVVLSVRDSEEDKIKAFASADLFLHPSRFEAFGIVVLEAMAQAKPILASNAGGLAWLLEDAGLVFEKDDFKDLQDKFKRLFYSATLRKQLSEKAHEKAHRFTWEQIATQLEEEYENILAQ